MSGLAIVERRCGALSKPEFSHDWEVLGLRDGGLLFNSVRGEQLRLQHPPSYLRELTDLMDGSRPISVIVDLVLRRHRRYSPDTVHGTIRSLAAQGMAAEALMHRASERLIPQALVRRFPFIYSEPRLSCYTYKRWT